MAFTTLIGAQDLGAFPTSGVRIFDCRFDLGDPDAGGTRFKAGCIPGAIYLHLERDLSRPPIAGQTGRHPLPDAEAFRSALLAHGVQATSQVVAYDDTGGMFAARLWWMVRWAGHFKVAVLDGGYQAWLALGASRVQDVQTVSDDGREATVGHVAKKNSNALGLAPAAQPSKLPDASGPVPVSMRAVRSSVERAAWTLLDARAADRFRGENETIDPVAGHIPGAFNAPFHDNLGADGKFLSRAALRHRFESLPATQTGKPVVCYCGSGVTAAHNILAMVHAGLPEPALYAGSWSEWITDPGNPIETTDRPIDRR